MVTITSILGNSQKLDGGAMFGHVPKSLWSQWIAPDEHNRISLACRALLIQEKDKNILLEAGIGLFFEPSLQKRYGVDASGHVLLDSLMKIGVHERDIDFVILSHLHFDHAGGLLSEWKQNEEQKLVFTKARFVVSKRGWERACNPHIRDRASFIPKLNELLAQSNRLIIIDNDRCDLLGENVKFAFTHGHTPGLMHTIYQHPDSDRSIIFVSDLIPGTNWIHLPVSMGYDRSAEQLIDEKKEMLEFAIKQNGWLFYTHDPKIALSKIAKQADGKFVPIDACEEFHCMDL